MLCSYSAVTAQKTARRSHCTRLTAAPAGAFNVTVHTKHDSRRAAATQPRFACTSQAMTAGATLTRPCKMASKHGLCSILAKARPEPDEMRGVASTDTPSTRQWLTYTHSRSLPEVRMHVPCSQLPELHCTRTEEI